MDDDFDSYLNSDTLRFIRFKARQIAGKYGFRRDEIEDLQQTLILECLERLPRFDPRRSCQRTFIRLVINRGIATLIAGQKAPCRDYCRCQHSLDAPISDLNSHLLGETIAHDGYPLDRGARPYEQTLNLKCDVQRATLTLSPQLRRVCHLLVATDHTTDVARATGVSRATLHRRMRAIRTTFSDSNLTEYLPKTAAVRGGNR